MKKKWVSGLAALLLSVSAWIPTVAYAENLQDALRWAYQDNPDLKNARASVRQALEAANITHAATRPNLNFLANYGINGGDLYVGNWRDNDRLTATLSASLTVYDGGKTALAVDANLAQARAANMQLQASEQTILLQTVRAYLDVLRDRALVSSAQNDIKTLSASRDSAQISYDSGAATITQLAQAKAAVAQARSSLAVSQANLARSKASYEALTGRAPGSLSPISASPSVPSSLQVAIDIGNLSAPIILAAVENERAAMFNLRRAKMARMPNVEISASASRANVLDGSEYVDSQTLGVQMAVPLFSGGSIPATERQARAALEGRAAETTATRISVQQNIANAWAALESANLGVRALEEVVKAQALADEGASVEYEVGALTLTDRLDAEQDLINARTNLLSAQYDQKYAAFQLIAAMGRLTIAGMGMNIPKIDPLVPATPPAQPKSDAAKAVEKVSDRWGN